MATPSAAPNPSTDPKPASPVNVTQAPSGPEHFLQRIKLFSGLSVLECTEVVKRMKRRDFPPNQVIVREGAPGNSMFFITAGLVEVRKKDPNTGIDFLLSEMGPGQNFGEMSLLTGKPRTATVTAVQPTTCAVLEQADFHQLMMQFPSMGLALTNILAERLEEANKQAGIEFINLSKLQFDPRVLALLPQNLMLQHRVIPIAFINNRLSLAMVNPNNILALDDVRRVIKGVVIEPVITTEDDFKKFMSSTYPGLMRKEQQQPDGKTELSGIGIGSSAGVSALPSAVVTESSFDLNSDLFRDLQMAEDSSAISENKQELMN